jgi:hypothetical protein
MSARQSQPVGCLRMGDRSDFGNSAEAPLDGLMSLA